MNNIEHVYAILDEIGIKDQNTGDVTYLECLCNEEYIFATREEAQAVLDTLYDPGYFIEEFTVAELIKHYLNFR